MPVGKAYSENPRSLELGSVNLSSELNEFKSMDKFRDDTTQMYNHINDVTSATAQDARAARETLPKLFNESSAINKQMETLSNNVSETRRLLEDRIANLNSRVDLLRQQIQSESSYVAPTSSTGYTTGYPIR